MKDSSSPCTYKVSVRIKNFNDIISFTYEISNLNVFQKLSYDEKLKILFSYPFRLETLY